MVKLESFDLCLDRLDGQYTAGDSVTGSVYLTVPSRRPVNIKDLNVTLLGEARTSWVNNVSDNIYDRTEPYLNLKQSFRHQLDELVTEQDHLPSGQHRFGFTFLLPPNLPSSYEGEYGYIRYTCLAEINATGGDQQQRASSLKAGLSTRNKRLAIEKAITVAAQVRVSDLSLNANCDEGVRKECGYETTAGCCGVGVGRLDASVSIPKSIFILGQSMPVEVWIENQLRRKSPSSAVINLVQEVHFHSISFFQSASDSKLVSKIVHSVYVDMPERGSEITRTVQIPIPSKLPATTLNQTLLAVGYKVSLEMADFEIVLPIGLASRI